MRPMMRLVLGIIVLVGILAAVSVGLPAHVTVARSVVINAPESAIFPYINNLHRFSDWSPWALRDPQLVVTYAGPEEGKGAQIQWTSQVKSVGTGSMEISGSEPNHTVDLAVNLNGLDGTGSYDIAPAGSGSKVTWTFGYDSGSSPLKRWKALMLDGFVGAEYRAGLDKLKDKIETERRPMAPTVELTPPAGGSSTQTEQPSGALPPGGAAPQGGTVPPNGAAPSGTAAPAGGAQTASTPTGTAAPTAVVTPAPAVKPPKKPLRRRTN
jgi:Polyketide cyclase / dehydrase and lipid transport